MALDSIKIYDNIIIDGNPYKAIRPRFDSKKNLNVYL